MKYYAQLSGYLDLTDEEIEEYKRNPGDLVSKLDNDPDSHLLIHLYDWSKHIDIDKEHDRLYGEEESAGEV